MIANWTTRAALFVTAIAGIAIGASLTAVGGSLETNAAAQSAAKKPLVSPVDARGGRGAYYPNTETLGPDEFRIISCGTGMPNARPSQAASCWLVELGNGDKFIFDCGTASADNIAALSIPYDFLDKVFLSHLHTDHFGDLDALFVGGLINGRQGPLRVWGPSGATPEMGTAYSLDHLVKALAWDIAGRAGRLPASGQVMEVHEFDFSKENQVVFDENGVVIRSWPANHVIDGSVSFALEWNGYKFVFGGDTYPNQWYDEYARDADVAIHECFITVPDLINKMNFPVDRALNDGTQIHTPPEAFGKVMSRIKPRHAIAYHFFNDFDTAPAILKGIRSTYDGPLTLADDMMVWNVTRDGITARDIIFDENVWSPPSAYPPPPVDASVKKDVSPWIIEKNLDMGDIIQSIYDRNNKIYGTDFKPEM